MEEGEDGEEGRVDWLSNCSFKTFAYELALYNCQRAFQLHYKTLIFPQKHKKRIQVEGFNLYSDWWR